MAEEDPIQKYLAAYFAQKRAEEQAAADQALVGSVPTGAMAAAEGRQQAGAQAGINSLLSNPADQRAYAGFDQEPGKFLPSLLKQENDLGNSYSQAQANWMQQHGGPRGVRDMSLQQGPNFNITGDDGKGNATGPGVNDFNAYPGAMPAWLKPNKNVPSYIQSRALAWRLANPQRADMGTGPDAISYDELQKASKSPQDWQKGGTDRWVDSSRTAAPFEQAP